MLTPDTSASMTALSGSSSTPTVMRNPGWTSVAPTVNQWRGAKPAGPSLEIAESRAQTLRANAAPMPAVATRPL